MPRFSDELEAWTSQAGERTVGSLVQAFGPRSFAVLFVFLLGVPALPLPTGGATHVFEVIAGLLALQLMAGRDEVWIPQRWARIELAGGRRERFVTGLLKLIRRLQRLTRPRLTGLLRSTAGRRLFGLITLVFSLGAFLAPPFSGLDTLPALGAVLVALSVLFEDFAFTLAGLAVGGSGLILEYVLGRVAFTGLSQLL